MKLSLIFDIIPGHNLTICQNLETFLDSHSIIPGKSEHLFEEIWIFAVDALPSIASLRGTEWLEIIPGHSTGSKVICTTLSSQSLHI